MKPDYYDAYNNLGVVYRRMGNDREAAACLLQALRINPQYPDALYNLGVIKLAMNKRRDALAQYQKLKSLDPALVAALYGGIYRGMVLNLSSK